MTAPRFRTPIALLLSLGLTLIPAFSSQSRQQKQSAEETADYFKKWLEEDVVYIITDQEKAVFNSLSTPLEKERFIEQFWIRRDTDRSTQENEFKLEHYRRVAYANEHFASGYPGWLTDRGRIYITFGPPDQRQTHSSGETYDRPLSEGGGVTQTYPWELWRYHHIEGIGSDVELEFVDRTRSGEFRLALLADEKDALTNVGISGPTLLEQLGLSNKTERGTSQELGFARERDSPFIRYETYTHLVSPREIRYTDLKAIVDVNTQFSDIPLTTRTDYIGVDENRVLALVTIQLANKFLNFEPGANGISRARLAIYGLVTSLSRRVITEFDDDLESLHGPLDADDVRGQRSVYQKIVPVDRKMRYKLDLVVRDIASKKVGMTQIVLDPPAHDPDRLASTALIFSESIRRVPAEEAFGEMFVIGDLKVRPNLTGEFRNSDPLGVYFQLYNARIDSSTLRPALSVAYRIMRGDEVLFQVVDREGESTEFESQARVVLVRRFKLHRLEPGQYTLQVQVDDRISGDSVTIQDRFRVVASP